MTSFRVVDCWLWGYVPGWPFLDSPSLFILEGRARAVPLGRRTESQTVFRDIPQILTRSISSCAPFWSRWS